MSTLAIDRRRHPRFQLEPMYTPIAVRTLDKDVFDIEGHAYDISEGGARFELDKPIAPGTKIAMQITLPNLDDHEIGPGRSIFVFANVIWIEDEDEPGPYKMAAVFTRFAKAYLPKTIAYVRSLPFERIGRCNVMGLEANDHGTVHRDGDPDPPEPSPYGARAAAGRSFR